ncbi:MAG: hypothetical protein RBT63_04180, partial [Bdellovibrionales bacterium]|nr:hypothetical protein [Bdellovibrionales bacterium]
MNTLKSFVGSTPTLQDSINDSNPPSTPGPTPNPTVKAFIEPFTVHENSQSFIVLMLDDPAPETVLISWEITSPDAVGLYTELSGSFSITQGATVGSFAIRPINNDYYSGDRQHTLSLISFNTSIDLRTSSTNFTLIDDEAKPTLQFGGMVNSSGQSVAESDSSEHTIRVVLSGKTERDVSYRYTVGGTANGPQTAPVDHDLMPATVTIAAGD